MADRPFTPENLSDRDLCLALEEMRRRGWACAVYAKDDVAALIGCDGDEEPTDDEIADWLKDNREELEETMCAAMHGEVNRQWNSSGDH